MMSLIRIILWSQFSDLSDIYIYIKEGEMSEWTIVVKP